MMKEVTIVTFEEMETIKNDIDSMINTAKKGYYGDLDGKTACGWLIEDLKAFRSQFE